MTGRTGMIVVSQEDLREFVRLSKVGSSYAALKAAAKPLEDALAGCSGVFAVPLADAVNLNDRAYVRLTPAGQQQLEAWHADLRASIAPAARPFVTVPEPDADGVLTETWHWFMEVFGSVCLNGHDFPFEGGQIYLTHAAARSAAPTPGGERA